MSPPPKKEISKTENVDFVKIISFGARVPISTATNPTDNAAAIAAKDKAARKTFFDELKGFCKNSLKNKVSVSLYVKKGDKPVKKEANRFVKKHSKLSLKVKSYEIEDDLALKEPAWFNQKITLDNILTPIVFDKINSVNQVFRDNYVYGNQLPLNINVETLDLKENYMFLIKSVNKLTK
jgi:hypothetical protein